MRGALALPFYHEVGGWEWIPTSIRMVYEYIQSPPFYFYKCTPTWTTLHLRKVEIGWEENGNVGVHSKPPLYFYKCTPSCSTHHLHMGRDEAEGGWQWRCALIPHHNMREPRGFKIILNEGGRK